MGGKTQKESSTASQSDMSKTLFAHVLHFNDLAASNIITTAS